MSETTATQPVALSKKTRTFVLRILLHRMKHGALPYVNYSDAQSARAELMAAWGCDEEGKGAEGKR